MEIVRQAVDLNECLEGFDCESYSASVNGLCCKGSSGFCCKGC